MRLTVALARRGYFLSLSGAGKLRIRPTPEQSLIPRLRHYRAALQAEVAGHQQRMEAQAVELEEKILAALERGAVSQHDAEERLTYVFRLTAACASDFPACSRCQEVLLWRYPDEEGLPVLCYSCHPPDASNVLYFLAKEEA